MRRAAKVDTTHSAIVAYFRKRGASVADIHTVPGLPDLIVGYYGRDVQVEVKGPKTLVAEHQRDYADDWAGRRPVVVRSEDDAENVLQGLRKG